LSDVNLSLKGRTLSIGHWNVLGNIQLARYTKMMTSGGIIDTQMIVAWKCNIPLKVIRSSFGWLFMIEFNLGFN